MKKQNPINSFLLKIYIKKIFLTKTQKRVYGFILLLFTVIFCQYLFWYTLPYVLADELPKPYETKTESSANSPGYLQKCTSFIKEYGWYIIGGVIIVGIFAIGSQYYHNSQDNDGREIAPIVKELTKDQKIDEVKDFIITHFLGLLSKRAIEGNTNPFLIN